MRWKLITGIGFFVIVALMAAVFVFLHTYDYNKLKPRITRMVREATGRELKLGGDINLALGFSPALVVTDITFANASWGTQPQMAKIAELQAQVRLLPLLARDVKLRRIGLTGVDVWLETNPDGQGNWEFSVAESPPKRAGGFKATQITADSIRIKDLNLTFRDGKSGSTTRFDLTDLELSRTADDDRLAVDLRAEYGGQPITLSGEIGLINKLLARQRIPVKLSGTFSEATVNLDGALADALNLRGIDLKVQTSGKNLAKLKLPNNIQLPETSAFDLAGHLKGSKEALALNDLAGNFSGADVHLSLSGTVGDLISTSGIDLQLKGSGKDLTEIDAIIDQKLPATDEFAVDGRLTGSLKVLTLQAAQASARRGSLSIALSGGIKDLLNFSGLDLKVKGSGKDLAEIGPIVDQKLPATDKFALEGRLTGSSKALTLQAATGNARRGSLSIALRGGIKDLLNFSDVDLKVKGSGKDLAEIGTIIDRKLPTTDKFALEGRLTGSAKTLSLSEAKGSAGRGSLDLALNGKIEDLLAFSGVDLKVRGSGKDLSELGAIIDQKLPATDEFAIEARMTGSAKTLSLSEASGSASRGSLNLTSNGRIKELFNFSGVDLKVKGSGKDLAEIGPIIDQKLPATDQFAVKARLTGSAKALSLQGAQGSASQGSLNLTLNGGIEVLPALEGINFKLKASGKELAEIGSVVGVDLPELGPFDVSGRLSGSARTILLNEFAAIIDKSDFNGLAKMEFLKRPKITVRLESSVIDFTALMESLEKDSPKPSKKDTPKRHLFSDDPLPFDILENVDADIVLKAKNIHAKDARLEFGHLTVKLEDSDFSIDRLEATYKQTKMSGNLNINAGAPPQLATNFLVQSFNLGDFLKETGKSDQVRAVVDIAAHGKSSGDSARSLMANLDGEFGAVMGKGYLTKYLDLLAVDLSQEVIPIWGRHKKAGEINCAVVQFDIKKGMASSQAFVFDTQVGIISAGGDINLGTEQVNFLLNPRPKDFSLVSLSTKLRVSGTLMHPKVRPDPLSIAKKGAELLGGLALGPIGLLAPFIKLGAHKKHPCEVKSLGELGLSVPAEK